MLDYGMPLFKVGRSTGFTGGMYSDLKTAHLEKEIVKGEQQVEENHEAQSLEVGCIFPDLEILDHFSVAPNHTIHNTPEYRKLGKESPKEPV